MDKAATTTQATAGCKPLTTFVQTDTHTFREVVQRLTGPSDHHHHHHHSNSNNTSTNPALQDQVVGNSKMMMMMGASASTSTSSVKRTTSKLHERRQCMRPKLEIVKPNFYFKPAESFSPSKAPSPLGTPSSIISKLSIQENKAEGEAEAEAAVAVLNRQQEERAIKERRFYLHPSPRGPRQLGVGDTTNQVPQLLTLFPLSSPRDATADDHKP